jgi:type III secretory pathway component EscU
MVAGMSDQKQNQTKPAPQAQPAPATQPARGGTNAFAIVSFVTGLLGIVVLGLVFGFLALDQIKQRNQEGHGLAMAGIIISFVYLGFGLLALVFVMVFFGIFASWFTAAVPPIY